MASEGCPPLNNDSGWKGTTDAFGETEDGEAIGLWEQLGELGQAGWPLGKKVQLEVPEEISHKHGQLPSSSRLPRTRLGLMAGLAGAKPRPRQLRGKGAGLGSLGTNDQRAQCHQRTDVSVNTRPQFCWLNNQLFVRHWHHTWGNWDVGWRSNTSQVIQAAMDRGRSWAQALCAQTPLDDFLG